MLATRSGTPDSIPSADPQRMVGALRHLRAAAAELQAALDFANLPDLFAAEARRRRDLYTELDALLAQMDAMRVQLAELVRAAEADPRPEMR
jgi:hypothetical protein